MFREPILIALSRSRYEPRDADSVLRPSCRSYTFSLDRLAQHEIELEFELTSSLLATRASVTPTSNCCADVNGPSPVAKRVACPARQLIDAAIELADRALRVRDTHRDEHVRHRHARRVRDFDDQLARSCRARRAPECTCRGCSADRAEPWLPGAASPAGPDDEPAACVVVLERRLAIAALLGERAERVVRLRRRQQPRRSSRARRASRPIACSCRCASPFCRW